MSAPDVSLSAKRGAMAGLFGLLISLAACGGNPSSPTAPSPPSVPLLTVYEPRNGVSVPTLVREVKPSYTAQAIAAGPGHGLDVSRRSR